MNKYVPEIERLSKLAQKLIDQLQSSDSNNETFEQSGILNGQEIVIDYIKHGELGLSLEHLLYMIHESCITFPLNELGKLHSLANELGVRNNYVDKNA